MEFQTLSHAGLRVSAGGKELICDPWLVGSVYWRSWWNYPPVPRDLVRSLKPDFIYLTHLHWDHFQADSLRLFAPETPVIVPFDRYERMTRDLATVGMTNVREIRHGERMELAPGLAIRSFQFAPFVTDSAVVIEAEDQVLFNANDAKFAGLPLRHILSHYDKIDFCFRSHSSANPRANFHYTDAPDEVIDDNEHYLRAFCLFQERVKPRYAIPFASNSCLLHDDVWDMNHLIQTPLAVAEYFKKFRRERSLATELQVMVPGDRWNETGFHIQEHDFFTNRDKHLQTYRERVRPAMERQAEKEAKQTVRLSQVETFFGELEDKVPGFLLKPLRGHEVLIVSKSAKKTQGFAVDAAAGKTREVGPEEFGDFPMLIEFPALILRQAISMNMFGHAGISKRVHYYAPKALMPTLQRLVTLLEWEEAELFPLRANFKGRSVRAALPRWREGVLYMQVLGQLARGRALPDIEERVLAGG